MKHRWAALPVVLAFCALLAGRVNGQGASQPPTGAQRIAGSLDQNLPNPFNPETWIPFHIGMEGNPPVCADANRQYRVSIRIYDAIPKLVAIPVILGGVDRGGQPLVNMALKCGDYTAHWDGTRLNSTAKVPSGAYLYVLEVDGKLTVKRMLVAK